MNNEEFMAERESFHEETTKIFDAKAPNYDTTSDRFEHFKRAASLKGCSPAEALMGMAAKHEVSLHDMAKGVSAGRTYDRKAWIAKLGDMRNYCDLLWGLLVAEGDV